MIPVKTGERIIGYLHTGQVLFKPPTVAGFSTVVERLKLRGIDVTPSEFRAAYFAVRFIPRARYGAIMRLLGAFAGHLSLVSADIVLKQNGNEPVAVSKARAYVDQNMGERLSLVVVARAVHMSPFYLCKIFKDSTGFTLIDYIARSRVSKVKVMLRDPLRRVSEAAFEAGFQSLSQFNRVFLRLEGLSPTRHRELQVDELIRLEEPFVRERTDLTAQVRQIANSSTVSGRWKSSGTRPILFPGVSTPGARL